MDFKFRFGRFKLELVPKPSEVEDVVLGINSDVYGDFDFWSDYHILMIDYDDNLKFHTLLHEIGLLQRTFDLGHCHIIESSPDRFHAVFFDDALDYFDCCRIIHESNADKLFKKWRMLRKNMTLRIGKKNKSDFGKPRLRAIVMNHPVEPFQYPLEVEDNIREFRKFYLQFVDCDGEVIVKNGKNSLVSS